MRKFNYMLVGLVTAGMLTLGNLTSIAQDQNRGEAKAKIGNANVSIEYGRPSLEGRDPLKLIRPGEPWRLGKNEPTTIESDRDLSFAGTKVSKGKHILLAMLDAAGKWWLVVSSKGNFEYEPTAKIAQAPMDLSKAQGAVGQLEIKLSGKDDRGTIEVAWGTLRLTAQFELAK